MGSGEWAVESDGTLSGGTQRVMTVTNNIMKKSLPVIGDWLQTV